ncbi:MAG TPA: Crp/Fnr family transcriptional regulator [Spirochaetota bacterium]|nr:Crp/Fnr family transcriptional regulator [Spirochaetota bacterium]
MNNREILKDQFDDIKKLLIKNMRLSNSTEEDLDIMLNFGFIKNYVKEQFVYKEDDKIEYFYIVIEGKVEIYKYTDKYLKRIFATLNKGDFFGLPELYEEKHLVNVLCLEKTKLLCIKKEDYFNNILKNHNIVLDLLRLSSRMIGDMQKTIITENAENKILSYLYYLKRKIGFSKNEKMYIPKKQTHEKIGEMLLLSRETVTRTLNSLKEKKIIDITADYYIVNDPKVFDDLAFFYDRMAGFYGSEK